MQAIHRVITEQHVPTGGRMRWVGGRKVAGRRINTSGWTHVERANKSHCTVRCCASGKAGLQGRSFKKMLDACLYKRLQTACKWSATQSGYTIRETMRQKCTCNAEENPQSSCVPLFWHPMQLQNEGSVARVLVLWVKVSVFRRK